MIEILTVIGVLALSVLTLIVCRSLWLRHTTGLWPSEIDQKLRLAELEKVELANKVYLARTERDLLSKINGLTAEKEQLRSRIKDLEADIENIRTAKDNAENTFLTFLTSLKE
jgi:uncharacterized protein YlxW (UPF0749 family)